jgi:hypothetical protein
VVIRGDYNCCALLITCETEDKCNDENIVRCHEQTVIGIISKGMSLCNKINEAGAAACVSGGQENPVQSPLNHLSKGVFPETREAAGSRG